MLAQSRLSRRSLLGPHLSSEHSFLTLPSLPSHPNCPHGMEYIIPVEGLIVNQHREAMTFMTGLEANFTYDVCDLNDTRLYLAAQKVESGQFLGLNRDFMIEVRNDSGSLVLLLERTNAARCECGGNVMTISNFDGGPVIGEVVEEGCCDTNYSLRDGKGNVLMIVKGPSRHDVVGSESFDIWDSSKHVIGQIHKARKRGYLIESYTDADSFGCSFPTDLDPLHKCIILGAVFLIDYLFLEDRILAKRRRRQGQES